ncbi:type VI secretion system Vgr family protein [Achromobacter marplatensis]|uniref:Type VI secretion system tip protein VgrG n=1 Tax=Achromobacter marplatensis TaxID=470868 RepID=A0AA42W830_9BURK|nr:type VI secretion system Vgr family protein [Achromobacter marplatensis]MDH2050383.1 type VI secretion system tip protein VgrG [Achromobacter marplatensis]
MAVNASNGSFSAQSRLYRLDGEGAMSSLQVEGWVAREGLSELGEMRVVALADNAALDLNDMVSRPATLWTTRADGSETGRSGVVRAAEMLGGNAGMARYRVTLAPWLWLATQRRDNRIYENQPVLEIVRHVLDGYEGYTYKVSAEVEHHLADLPARSYTTQYRETDYAFLSRLLAESGLGWTTVEDEAAPARHAVLIFADSRSLAEDAESAGAGVRFQRAHATESRDGVQALARRRRRGVERVTVLAWHESGKHAISGQALAGPANASGDDGAGLEWFEPLGHGSLLNQAHAQFQATLLMEAVQASAETFLGRGNVRTFRSGTRFTLQDMSPLGPAGESGFEPVFALDRLEHAGVNNLPGQADASMAAKLGALDDFLCFEDDEACEATDDNVRDHDDALIGVGRPEAAVLARAHEVGYANRFRAVRCDRPWRALPAGARGARLVGAPSAVGVHTAIVTNAEGATEASGEDEIYRNARGDVRVRFHWQADGDGLAKSRWARVAQRQAGAGMGMSFVPRIGQEVLVRFLDEDIDQPLVVGALYNGRGEGGIPSTPGGKSGEAMNTEVFAAATDGKPSAQANLASGNAPAWHGAAGGDEQHRNAAALSGFKSKEFGGDGYNQIVFDDSDGQLRMQIKSTQSASELNLGHLIHQSGNYRGNVRGVGAELRTDAFGALRGGGGVLLTTYTAGASEPAGDAAAPLALAGQADLMAQSFDGVVGAHQGVRLAAARGTTAAGASRLDGERAPLAAMTHAVSGTVAGDAVGGAAGDASAKHTEVVDGKVPHLTDPLVLMAGRAGLTQAAGRNVQVTAGELVHWSSGQDHNLAVIGSLRVHTGQALGIVAGVQKGGAESGLDLIAGTGEVDVISQHDVLTMQAQQDLRMVSANAGIEYASPKRIRIANAAGASIVIEGGNITVTAPGRIDVKTGNKQFAGPTQMPYPFPQFTVCKSCVLDAQESVQSITDKA